MPVRTCLSSIGVLFTAGGGVAGTALTHVPINYEIDNQSQMNPPTSLDQLKIGMRARISAIDWTLLGESEASRLRHFGFDEGVAVQPLHLGPFGRDPLAVRVGRMTVAIRRSHARAVSVVPEAA